MKIWMKDDESWNKKLGVWDASSGLLLPRSKALWLQLMNLDLPRRLLQVGFDVWPRTSGASFTPIFESSSNGKNFASVNAGNPKKLKASKSLAFLCLARTHTHTPTHGCAAISLHAEVGGGTINGQFAQDCFS